MARTILSSISIHDRGGMGVEKRRPRCVAFPEMIHGWVSGGIVLENKQIGMSVSHTVGMSVSHTVGVSVSHTQTYR